MLKLGRDCSVSARLGWYTSLSIYRASGGMVEYYEVECRNP